MMKKKNLEVSLTTRSPKQLTDLANESDFVLNLFQDAVCVDSVNEIDI